MAWVSDVGPLWCRSSTTYIIPVGVGGSFSVHVCQLLVLALPACYRRCVVVFEPARERSNDLLCLPNCLTSECVCVCGSLPSPFLQFMCVFPVIIQRGLSCFSLFSVIFPMLDLHIKWKSILKYQRKHVKSFCPVRFMVSPVSVSAVQTKMKVFKLKRRRQRSQVLTF